MRTYNAISNPYQEKGYLEPKTQGQTYLAAASTAARVSGRTARCGARHHQAGAGVASPGRSHYEAYHRRFTQFS
jgi:hypothetical protein